MLHRFSAKRYRHLDADNLELGRLNLLVGPNNAGKSTFIKTIRFAADLLVPRASGSAFLAALDAQGRGDVLDHVSPVPGDVDLCWTLSSAPGAAALTYELGFKVGRSEDFPSGFYITRERLRYDQPAAGHQKPFWFFERNERSPEDCAFAVMDGSGQQKRLVLSLPMSSVTSMSNREGSANIPASSDR
jgi:predicted ATPase